jgi:hypothetical protein
MSLIVTGTDTVSVRIPFLGEVVLPPPDGLAWYAGVALLALTGIIEWQGAIVLAIGKALVDSHRNRILEEFGRALKAAR